MPRGRQIIQSLSEGSLHVQGVRPGLLDLAVGVRQNTKDAVSDDDVGRSADLYSDGHRGFAWHHRNAREVQIQANWLAQADDMEIPGDERHGNVCVGRDRHGGQTTQYAPSTSLWLESNRYVRVSCLHIGAIVRDGEPA